MHISNLSPPLLFFQPVAKVSIQTIRLTVMSEEENWKAARERLLSVTKTKKQTSKYVIVCSGRLKTKKQKQKSPVVKTDLLM